MKLDFQRYYRGSLNNKINCPICKREMFWHKYDDIISFGKNIFMGCDPCAYELRFKSLIKNDYVLWDIRYGQYHFSSNDRHNYIQFPTTLKEFITRMSRLALLGVPNE